VGRIKLNIIVIVIETGKGKKEVSNYVALKRINQVKKTHNNIRYEELYEIGRIWVEAALKISAKDLKLIEHLIKRIKITIYCSN